MRALQEQQIPLKRILVVGILLVSTVVWLLPFVWMLSTSLKKLENLFVYPPVLIPEPIEWQNYTTIFNYVPLGLYFRNSLIIAILWIAGNLLSCSLVAYGFAFLRFPGRQTLFGLMLATLMIPYIVRLVPTYLLFSKLGWLNTYLPLTVPGFFGFPLYIFLLRQFFKSIPRDLIDAATIDGASHPGIWWKVVLPLSVPSLVVIAIMAFQYAWTDFLAPLVYLNDVQSTTLAVGLWVMYAAQAEIRWELVMAGSVISMLPPLIIFALFQRQFIQGVTLTGMKG